ncbi:unnamed protein product [Amoebophrya sp. A25]|nr:unnamed protein product [Amoebophrya sp. A25]|eukprot:GSA25T00020533001.1
MGKILRTRTVMRFTIARVSWTLLSMGIRILYLYRRDPIEIYRTVTTIGNLILPMSLEEGC